MFRFFRAIFSLNLGECVCVCVCVCVYVNMLITAFVEINCWRGNSIIQNDKCIKMQNYYISKINHII